MTTLEIIRGTTTPFTFVIKQSGVPVDLTGKQLVFVASTAPQTTKKTGVSGSGFTITDAESGIATLQFTVAETRGMTPNKIDFTLELWESAGSTQTLILERKINCRTVVNVDA